jgi:hypothetical protein
MALRTTAWMWVKNKENRGCIGCHEDDELAPENVLPKALTHPPAQLTLPPERRRTVGFRRDVAPVLRMKCAGAACHGQEALTKPALLSPGSARSSALIRRIYGRGGAPMPPRSSPPLTDDEKRMLIEWIDLGAQP